MGQLIIVSGNLGAGKTTLTTILAERLGAVAFSEEPRDHPFLNDMYADVERWCLHNQLSFMAKKAAEQISIHTSEAVFIQEIGLQETHEVYSRAFLECGVLTDREFELLQNTLSLLSPQLPAPAVSVYLRAPIELALHRVAARRRPGEPEVWPAFMGELERQFDLWYGQMGQEASAPVVQVDMGKIDFVRRAADLEYVLSEVAARLPHAQSGGR